VHGRKTALKTSQAYTDDFARALCLTYERNAVRLESVAQRLASEAGTIGDLEILRYVGASHSDLWEDAAFGDVVQFLRK
jgi:hypothetical protein